MRSALPILVHTSLLVSLLIPLLVATPLFAEWPQEPTSDRSVPFGAHGDAPPATLIERALLAREAVIHVTETRIGGIGKIRFYRIIATAGARSAAGIRIRFEADPDPGNGPWGPPQYFDNEELPAVRAGIAEAAAAFTTAGDDLAGVFVRTRDGIVIGKSRRDGVTLRFGGQLYVLKPGDLELLRKLLAP